jgi:hypothetical protein
MKGLILIFSVIVGSQANAAKLVCINSAHNISPEPENSSQIDQPEVIDYLEIVGLLDSEGLLEVRADQPTIGTFVSKPNHLDICQGMNINPDQDPQSPNAGWKTAKLDSLAFRVRLERNQQTGEVQAIAAVPDRHVNFRNCWFIKEADDDEIVRNKMEELSKPLDEEPAMRGQNSADASAGAEGAK